VLLISPEKLEHILEEHREWVESEREEGEEADLSGANLQQANLGEANLIDVKNFTQAQLDQACVDEHTKLPEGLTRPEPCPEEALSQK
jgi:hypothetical protein